MGDFGFFGREIGYEGNSVYIFRMWGWRSRIEELENELVRKTNMLILIVMNPYILDK